MPAGPSRKYDKAVFDEAGNITTYELGKEHGGYHDIDACPSLDFLIAHRDDAELGKYLGWSVDRRSAEELFDIRSDPACLHNLAGDAKFADIQTDLREQLMSVLKSTGDARVLDGGDVWESYPRVSGVRWFETPAWAKEDATRVPDMPWLRKRQPRK